MGRKNKIDLLSDYMKERAAFEHVEWAVTDEFLEEHFASGIRSFFGVTLDDDGKLLTDDQQPELFANYQRRI